MFVIGFLAVAVLFIYLEWRERVAKGRGGIMNRAERYVAGTGFHHYPERGGVLVPGFGCDRRGPPQLGLSEKVKRKLGLR